MRNFVFFFCLALMLMARTAFAADNCITAHVPDASIIGSGKGKYLVFNIYNAELYAPNGSYSEKKPFALRLTYHMNFKRNDIANESIRQIRHLGMKDEKVLLKWYEDMEKIFPDVKPGDSLTGIHLTNGQTLFCHAGHEIGSMSDKEFGHYFFGIWLDKGSEDPVLRRNLLRQA